MVIIAGVEVVFPDDLKYRLDTRISVLENGDPHSSVRFALLLAIERDVDVDLTECDFEDDPTPRVLVERAVENKIREVIVRIASDVTRRSDITSETQLDLSDSLIVVGDAYYELQLPAWILDYLDKGMTIEEIAQELIVDTRLKYQ